MSIIIIFFDFPNSLCKRKKFCPRIGKNSKNSPITCIKVESTFPAFPGVGKK